MAGIDDDAWKELDEKINSSRHAFLDAGGVYDRDGKVLEQKVRDQLAPYYDPAKGRARRIQDSARALSDELPYFSSTRGLLTLKVATLTVGFSATTSALGTAGLNASAKGMSSPGTGLPGSDFHDRLQATLEYLDEIEKVALAVGREMDWAFRLATAMIKLRQAELQTYLDEIPRVAPVRAVLGAIVEEAPLAGLGFGLSVLAAGTPLGELVTGVISVGKRVREKVRAVNAYYERDSQDDMLDLADAVDGDREIFAYVSELLDEIQAFFTQASADAEEGR